MSIGNAVAPGLGIRRRAPKSAAKSPRFPLERSRVKLKLFRRESFTMNRQFLLLLALLPMAVPPFARGEDVRFNRDVRPIFAEHCLSCHGPDEKGRQAELRLDQPGVDRDELIARVTSDDPDVMMPPPRANKPLARAEIETLKSWIAQGGQYERHWAFMPLARSDLAGIDEFVEMDLRKQGVTFAPQAEAAALVRRVSLDLTGLPPEPNDWPTSDTLSETDYERLVDRLLASPRFGEHLAVAWLDAARYADTNGYFSDKPRRMWPWRDWVIEAFNSNMPFDRFTIEQLAGDLLPGATRSQRIATGFNRNTMANNETGAVAEEFRVQYVVDRVNTTMATWLGLTAGCAQCHDHKFDPISRRDYYRLFAFFNNVPEKGVIESDNPPPILSVPSPEQEGLAEQAARERADAQASFEPVKLALKPKFEAWQMEAQSASSEPPEAVWHESFSGIPADAIGTTLELEAGPRGQAAKFDGTRHIEFAMPSFDLDGPWTLGFWARSTGPLGCPLSLIEPDGRRRGLEILWQKGRIHVHLVHDWGIDAIEICSVDALPTNTWRHVVLGYDGGKQAAGLSLFIDGERVTTEIHRDSLSGSIRNQEPLRIGRRDSGLGFYGLLDEARITRSPLDESVIRQWFLSERRLGILEKVTRSADDEQTLLDDYITSFADEATRAARDRLTRAIADEKRIRESIPTTLVMEEMNPPRETRMLERGEYDKPGEVVSPGVPDAIAPWTDNLPPNRLGFANWLFREENPLAARVAVNRLWRHCFGEGLVRTVEDFGSRGEAPSHPELLDWLAGEYRRTGWDTKALLKRIVMSRTYRQSSRWTHAGDPENRLLARGPSGRLSAETIRDQALAISGLLSSKIGGPSVMPFQPPGLWEAVSYNEEESYMESVGEDRWRRGLYTFVKRQSPPPSLLTFDGPTRETCVLRRPRTNTPLQSLLLLNDKTFVEAAEALANRSEGQPDRIAWMFQLATGRTARPEELAVLRGLFERRRSLALVGHTILNLDETISKR